MQVKGLAHIGIRVRDMDVSVKFYTELLGFKVTGRQMLGTTELCFLENGSCPLELIHSATHDERVPGQIDHFALEVQHIDELVNDLKAKGVTFLTDGDGQQRQFEIEAGDQPNTFLHDEFGN